MEERSTVQVLLDTVEDFHAGVVLTGSVSQGLAYLHGIVASAEVLANGLYTSAAWAGDPGIKASLIELVRLFDRCLKELQNSRGGLRVMPATLRAIGELLERMDKVRRVVR